MQRLPTLEFVRIFDEVAVAIGSDDETRPTCPPLHCPLDFIVSLSGGAALAVHHRQHTIKHRSIVDINNTQIKIL